MMLKIVMKTELLSLRGLSGWQFVYCFLFFFHLQGMQDLILNKKGTLLLNFLSMNNLYFQ